MRLAFERDEKETVVPMVAGTITVTFTNKELLNSFRQGEREFQNKVRRIMRKMTTKSQRAQEE